MTVTRIKGPTIMTASGHYFDLENPQPSAINIEVIAHALSNICRYTGHCREFYSVAQHSVLVSRIVPPQDALAGLLHDAAEAFIGDVSKPLKCLLPDYKIIESRIEATVFAHFGLPPELPESVKIADRVLLRTEQRDLMGADGHEWAFTQGAEPLQQTITPKTPNEAREEFLFRYQELTHETQISRAQRCPPFGHDDDFIPVELLLDPDLTDEKVEAWRESQKQLSEEKPEWIDIPPCLRRSTD